MAFMQVVVLVCAIARLKVEEVMRWDCLQTFLAKLSCYRHRICIDKIAASSILILVSDMLVIGRHRKQSFAPPSIFFFAI